MRTIVSLLALVALAGGQEEKARERLQQDFETLQRRIADLREQVETLPRESALREEKVRQLRHGELDLEIWGEKLRTLAAKKAPEAAGPPAVKLQDVRLLESRYATRAKNPVIAEGESLWLRLTVTGLKRTDDGIAFAYDVRLLDSAGKAVVNLEDVSRGEVEDQFDCRSFTSHVGLENLRGVTGKFTLEVTAHDRKAGAQDVWKAGLEIRKPELGLYNVRFTADEEGKIEIPATFPLGGQRFVKFKALGFSAQAGQLHLGDGFEIYDDRMNRLYALDPTPEGTRGRVPESWSVPATRKLNCVKPGSYVLRLIVVDHLSGTKSHRDVPFRVLSDREY
jgi:hypothetical protein